MENIYTQIMNIVRKKTLLNKICWLEKKEVKIDEIS